MKLFILIVGYDRSEEWYKNSVVKLAKKLKFEKLSFLAVDNKSGLCLSDKNNLDYFSYNTNDFFEFTGYYHLINMASRSYNHSDLFLIINDTFFTNHAYFFWLKGIEKSISKVRPREVVGDLRLKGNSLYPNYPFHASWLFFFTGVDLPDFQIALKNTIDAARLNMANYLTVSESLYALNIRGDCRRSLIKWLFHPSWFRGWPFAESFNNMPFEKRYRKGLCIFMEHFLGPSLIENDLVLLDLKKISVLAWLANIFDRLINIFQRIKYKIIFF